MKWICILFAISGGMEQVAQSIWRDVTCLEVVDWKTEVTGWSLKGSLHAMNVPDLPPDLKFRMLTPTNAEVEFSFQAKKQALGPHIIRQWGWDEKFQREVHDQRLREKPFYQIELNGQPIGTISLQLRPEFLRFGEFYLLDSFRGLGIGSRILAQRLQLADNEVLPVRLEYLLWNPVGSLYRRNGFVEVGRTSTHFLMERPNRRGSAIDA